MTTFTFPEELFTLPEWTHFHPSTHSLDDLVEGFRQTNKKYAPHVKPISTGLYDAGEAGQDLINTWLKATQTFLKLAQSWGDPAQLTTQQGIPLFSLFLDPHLYPLYPQLGASFWKPWLERMQQGDFSFAYYNLSSSHPRPPHWPQGELRLTPLYALHLAIDQLRFAQHSQSSGPSGGQPREQVEDGDKDYIAHTLSSMLTCVLEHEGAIPPGAIPPGSTITPNQTPQPPHTQRKISINNLKTSVEEHLISIGSYGQTELTSHFLAQPIHPDAWFQHPERYPEHAPWKATPIRRKFTEFDLIFSNQTLFQQICLHHLTLQPSHPHPQHDLILLDGQPALSMCDQLYVTALQERMKDGTYSTRKRTLELSWRDSPLVHVFYALDHFIPDYADMRRDMAYLVGHQDILLQRRERLPSPALDLFEEMLPEVHYNNAYQKISASTDIRIDYERPTFFTEHSHLAWGKAQRKAEHIESFWDTFDPNQTKSKEHFRRPFDSFPNGIPSALIKNRLLEAWTQEDSSSYTNHSEASSPISPPKKRF